MMIDRLIKVCVALGSAVAVTAGWAAPLRLADSGNALAKIVVSDEATVAERKAAEELAHYLDLITGAQFKVFEERNVSSDEVQILVGQSPRAQELVKDVDFDRLSSDEIVIERAGNSLVIAGDRPRGTLYATYQFLEEFLGCRWWTPNESDIPRQEKVEIDKVRLRYAPPFWYRLGPTSVEERFITQMRDNANRSDQTPEWGGRHEILGWVHTFSELLPPDKYFKEHPEWYTDPENQYLPCTANSKVPEAQSTELCTTNSEVVDEMITQALALIETNPQAGYISISQNDNSDGYCRCETCTELVKREGSPSALIIQFVNRVAEKVGEKYPDFLVETLAYHFSEKPPKTIKPAKNVVVRMAPIARDFGHKISHKGNEKLRKNLEAWQAAGANLFIWDYVTNFHHVMMPHPNLLLLGDTLRFYKDHGVKAMFLQGNVYSKGVGDFAGLRTWLIGQLMWNPEQDDQKLVDEYLKGYFGAAAPYLREYMDLISSAYSVQDKDLSTFNIDFSYLTLSVMNKATELFDKAAAAVKDNPVLAERVARERLSVALAWLWQYKDYRRVAKAAGEPFLGPEDPHRAIEELEAAMAQYGVPRYRETIETARLVALLKGHLAKEYDETVPLPAGLTTDNEEFVIDLQENSFFQDSANLWTRVTDDVEASNKKAGELRPGDRFEMYFTTLGLSMKPGKWQIYVLVKRPDSGANDSSNAALTFGVFDRTTLKDFVTKTLDVPAIGQDYQMLDGGIVELHPECIMWLSYPDTNLSNIHVDRVVLIRQEENHESVEKADFSSLPGKNKTTKNP